MTISFNKVKSKGNNEVKSVVECSNCNKSLSNWISVAIISSIQKVVEMPFQAKILWFHFFGWSYLLPWVPRVHDIGHCSNAAKELTNLLHHICSDAIARGNVGVRVLRYYCNAANSQPGDSSKLILPPQHEWKTELFVST